jgi:cytochrome P450
MAPTPIYDEDIFSDQNILEPYEHYRKIRGFGIGRHVCTVQHLARLEIECLLRAMITRIGSFEIEKVTPQLNNILRGVAELTVTVQPIKTFR